MLTNPPMTGNTSGVLPLPPRPMPSPPFVPVPIEVLPSERSRLQSGLIIPLLLPNTILVASPLAPLYPPPIN